MLYYVIIIVYDLKHITMQENYISSYGKTSKYQFFFMASEAAKNAN